VAPPWCRPGASRSLGLTTRGLQAKRQPLLFYTPDTEPLAMRIKAQEDMEIELASIAWDNFAVRAWLLFLALGGA